MNDLPRYLTDKFVDAFDRYEEHMRNADPMSPADLQEITPLTWEMLVAQWAANLDIKTKHDLMRSSIDAIR